MIKLQCSRCEIALETHLCLICGRYELCTLSTKETSKDANWPGAPCTFDYEHLGIVMHPFTKKVIL